MTEPMERSDFEARLACMRPSPTKLTWSQLQASLDEAAPASQSVSLARTSRIALIGSWMGGMAVGASLMFLLLNSWGVSLRGSVSNNSASTELTHREALTNSKNSGTDGRSRTTNDLSPSLAQQAEQKLAPVSPNAISAPVESFASQRWWLESLMLRTEAALNSKYPLTAGEHFVSVRNREETLNMIPVSRSDPDSDSNNAFRSGVSESAPSTPRRLLQDILEQEGDLLL